MAADSPNEGALNPEQDNNGLSGVPLSPSEPDDHTTDTQDPPSSSQQHDQKPKQAPPTGDPTKCDGCGQTFPSRNAVFRHLKETNGACLLENLSSEQDKEEQYREFEEHVRRTDKLQKVLILYGYLSFSIKEISGSGPDGNNNDDALSIHNGQDAGRILIEAVQQLQNDLDGVTSTKKHSDTTANPSSLDRLNRSYGNTSKVDDCIRQDPDTAAISEVMAVRLRPLRMGMTEEEWMDRVQKILDRKYESLLQQQTQGNIPATTPIRILGRLELPTAHFNAETDVTQRRIEYLLPVDFLTWSMEYGSKENISSSHVSRPAAVSSSVKLTTGSSKKGKSIEGWDLPAPVAVPSSRSKTGWKTQKLQWKTPQRIASLSPVTLPLASKKTTNSKTEPSTALMDENNVAGRLFCAPLIVANGRFVLVASGATLLLYQVTSSMQEPLESLPLPARSVTPVTKLTLVVEDAFGRDRANTHSKTDNEQPKRVGDIRQMIFHEESSIVYVLTVDCCVFQIKLHNSLVDSNDDWTQSDFEKTLNISPANPTEGVDNPSTSEIPSLSIWRKYQTTEFGAACMATLHNGGGEGSDVVCVGYNSGTIECWLITQQQPEMVRSLHKSRRPQRREKSSVLRWKGYTEQSVKTLAFMRQTEDKIDKAQMMKPSTVTQEAPSSKIDNLIVSNYCLIVSTQSDLGPMEDNGKRPYYCRVEVLDLTRIFEARIEFPRKDAIALQHFALPTSPNMNLIDAPASTSANENSSKRSPMLEVNCADAATVLSNHAGRNPQLGITLPDGTVALFSCNQDSQSGSEVGIVKDHHQILLSFPAVGSGALRVDGTVGKDPRHFLACCLRGGTCYLIPTEGETRAGSITVLPYPHDISSDLDQVYIQSFTAGNLRVGDEGGLMPVLIYAMPGGIVDIYSCELLYPRSNAVDGVLAEPLRSDNFGPRIRNELPVFSENHKHDINHIDESAPMPEEDIRLYMTDLKNIMKLLRTHIVAVDLDKKASVWEKQNNLKRRKQQKLRRKETKDAAIHCEAPGGDDNPVEQISDKGERQAPPPAANAPDDSNVSSPLTTQTQLSEVNQQNYLKRKRFHNFTANVMAHQYLAYRRLDRLYHRATLELPFGMDNKQTSKFAVISMSGDMFLTGQAQRVIGVFLALANGVIDKEFVECIFDEDYPHLVPTPPAPRLGTISAEAHYMNTEGKIKSVLSPRVSKQYDRGFNQRITLLRVKEWQEHVYNHIANCWESNGRATSSGRLNMEQQWTENVLLPWAEKARKHLEDYRLWKRSQSIETKHGIPNANEGHQHDDHESIVPSIDTVDPSVPEAFEEVLRCLREVDASGEWPSTTPKRQLVMVSTQDGKNGDGEQANSLAIAHSKAKRNVTVRSSAYSFTEGQGGASGSFSVGFMPGGVNKQPKANSMFPELVKAAFELERKLCPLREPSSTIAINRNAQFRPHTDSGAGAGQSTSLIVGLGTYSGGELMVEGVQHDIRYKAIEFNGWKQRHWTLPFKGERYSLVWFTPKGCEGMRGIDLDL